MTSLRRTLLGTLLASVSVVTLAAAFLVYQLAREELDAIFDYHLRQLALSLRDQARVRLPGSGGEGFDYLIQIWDRDGVRLYVSEAGAGVPQSAQLGFATLRTPGGTWRAYTVQHSDLVVQVAQPERVRRDLAVAAAWRTLSPVLLVLPLLALLVWGIVSRALAPLDRLARSVGARSPVALEPIPEDAAPEEAVPLVRSLNDLLARLGTALAAQRAFVADAAHALRTPLAALRLQSELVERAAGEEERAAAVTDLRAGLDRATRVVLQLLALARAEPDTAPAAAGEPVALAELVSEVVADHAVLAESRRIDLGATQASAEAVVAGDAVALRTLLANLVDNAIRYTPAGGRVDVAAAIAGGRPYLEVLDSGPGIPAADRAKVFDRFYRRRGAASDGSGLGLAIVKAVAERHGAVVALGAAPGGGLAARVTFPPSATRLAPVQPAGVAPQEALRP